MIANRQSPLSGFYDSIPELSRPSGSFPVIQYGKILKKNEILLNFRFYFSYNGLLFQIRRVTRAKQNGFMRETLIYT